MLRVKALSSVCTWLVHDQVLAIWFATRKRDQRGITRESITSGAAAFSQNSCRTLTRRCTRRGVELPLKAFLNSGAAAVLGACACIMQVAMACKTTEGQPGALIKATSRFNRWHGLLQQSQSFQAAREADDV